MKKLDKQLVFEKLRKKYPVFVMRIILSQSTNHDLMPNSGFLFLVNSYLSRQFQYHIKNFVFHFMKLQKNTQK